MKFQINDENPCMIEDCDGVGLYMAATADDAVGLVGILNELQERAEGQLIVTH